MVAFRRHEARSLTNVGAVGDGGVGTTPNPAATNPQVQSPAQSLGQRPAMAETPNTDLYYKLAPDAIPQEGVPKGEIRRPFTLPSDAYPGTQHTYWVYVPAQYDPGASASLMIYNDGQAFLAPEGDVRDSFRNGQPDLPSRDSCNDRRFYQSGPPPRSAGADSPQLGRSDTNRPTEYNTLDDKYARVIVDELLPVLYKEYNLSKDPERHGIGGSSSGAHCGFHRRLGTAERLPKGPEQCR